MDLTKMLADYGLTYDDKLLHLTDFRIDNEYHGPIRLSVEFTVDPYQNFPPQVLRPMAQPANWPPPTLPAKVTGTRKRSEASPLNDG